LLDSGPNTNGPQPHSRLILREHDDLVSHEKRRDGRSGQAMRSSDDGHRFRNHGSIDSEK